MAIDQPGSGAARRYERPAEAAPTPPPIGDQIRISDAERGTVVELLSQATTEGRLTWDEYTERTDRVYAARYESDIVGLIDDLPHGPILGIPGNQKPSTTYHAPAPPRPVLHQTPGVLPAHRSTRIVCMLGNEARRGRWVVPERMTVESYLGECHIALQDATFEAHETTIDARAICGSITIVVPEGVKVRLSGRAVLGSKEVRVREMPPPGAPVTNVICDVLLGSVVVRPQRWGWVLGQLQRR